MTFCSIILLTRSKGYGNEKRVRGSADVAVLLVSDMNACGQGYVDTWRSVPSK